MIYLLLGLIFIIGIILAVEDFKTYSVSSILFYIYSGLLTILFWNLQFPFFFIPIVCLGLLFIKSENINGTDLYILCILFYIILMLKRYSFNIFMLLPLLVAFIIIFIFNKNKIPFVTVGTSLIFIYVSWLLIIFNN